MAKTDKIIEGLTQHQALFVSEYLKTANATESYKKAGYKVKNENSAASSACSLLRNPKIARAIEERQQRRNKALELEEDYELKTALELVKMCMTPKHVYNFDGSEMKDKEGSYVMMFDSKGANAALTTVCRLRGKFKDKQEVDINVSDRAGWLAEALKGIK